MEVKAQTPIQIQPNEFNSVGKNSGVSPKVNSNEFKELLKSSFLNGDASTQTRVSDNEAKAPLKFSNHALERMQLRGVRLDPTDMKNLESAVQRAAAKGSKDSLVLSDKAAFVVSVKNNTVVTVMDRANLKDNVFTQIDSTIVI